MAKRKQKGAAYGKKSGGGAQVAFQRNERSRLGCYTILGVAGVLFLCIALAGSGGLLNFGGISGDSSIETDSGIVEDGGFESESDGFVDEVDDSDNGFEAVSDSVEMADDTMSDEADHSSDDSGFSASSDSVDTGASSGNFELLDGDFGVADLAPAARDGFYSSYPDFIIDESNEYEAVLVTEKGDIRVRLFDDEAPLTVNNFVYLAQDGFYDDTTFHRVIEGFMAQAGDPSGTGAGGPGYRFEDETDNGLVFDRSGLLAMANAGPGTNGSQFFITYDATSWLDGNHTIFGEVIEGADVVDSLRIRDPQRDPELGDIIETVEIYVAE